MSLVVGHPPQQTQPLRVLYPPIRQPLVLLREKMGTRKTISNTSGLPTSTPPMEQQRKSKPELFQQRENNMDIRIKTG
jgi:hypothetical protein